MVKELIDNALDGAESAGRAPVIEIDVRCDGELTWVTVADNGAGIAPATVADVCNFSVLVSDKARYRGPARGAQGNALKTLLGILHALDVDKPVVIESAGVRHELQVTIDGAGAVTVDHHTTASDRVSGTSVTVPLPADLKADVGRWAFGAALVNPHATITAANHAYSDTDGRTVFYKPTDNGWSKWTPAAPSSPHWYDRSAFAALVASHVHHTRRTGDDVPLGRFISEFDGLSGSAKQKKIRMVAEDVTHLSGLDGRDDLVAALHAAMCEHAKPTPIGRLGAVGADHCRRLLDDESGVVRFWHKVRSVTVDGGPWIIEAAELAIRHELGAANGGVVA